MPGGFNLGLVMRHLIGVGTPRGLQDRLAAVIAALLLLLGATRRWLVAIFAWHPLIGRYRHTQQLTAITPFWRSFESSWSYTTGC